MRTLFSWLFLAIGFLNSLPIFAQECVLPPTYVAKGPAGDSFGPEFNGPLNIDQLKACYPLDTHCTIWTKSSQNGAEIPGLGNSGCDLSNSADGKTGSYYCSGMTGAESVPYAGDQAGGYTVDIIQKVANASIEYSNAQQEPLGITTSIDHIECKSKTQVNTKPAALENNPFKDAQKKKADIKTCSEKPGSIINTRDRSLGQSIPVAGTGLTLEYSTNNFAIAPNKARKIPVTVEFPAPISDDNGDHWKPSDIIVTLNIAGRVLSHSFGAPGLLNSIDPHYEFEWDGSTLSSRSDKEPIIYSLTTIFKFANSWTENAVSMSSIQYFVLGAPDVESHLKLGGWALSNYNYYDAPSKTVYQGDGSSLSAEKPITNAEGHIEIASIDGDLIYVFLKDGRQLSTRTTITGVTIETFEYDANGLLTAIVDRDGLRTTLERDGSGEVTTIVNSYGMRTKLHVNVAGNLEEIEDPNGHKNSFYYLNGAPQAPMVGLKDPAGHMKVYTFDEDSKLISAQNAKGGLKQLSFSSSANFDSTVDTTEFSSPMGRKTVYEVQRNHDGTITDKNTFPEGYFTSHTDSSSSKDLSPTTLHDSRFGDETVSYGQHPLFGDRVVVTQDSIGYAGAGTYSSSKTYQGSSSSIQSYSENFTENFSPSGSVSYDKASNTFKSTSAMGFVSTSILDSKGRVAQVDIPGVRSLTYKRDSQGRVIEVRQGERFKSYAYDAQGNLASSQDALGQTVAYQYDAAGQLISQTLPNGKVLKIALNENDLVDSVTNLDGQTYTYSFDENSNVTLNTEPMLNGKNTVWSFNYNADDQPTVVSTPDASRIETKYNDDGTVQSVSDGKVARNYTWSNGQLQSVSTEAGQITSVQASPLPQSYSWSGPVNGNISLHWDNFLLGSIAYDDGTTIYNNYDSDHFLIAANDINYTRDLNGFLAHSQQGIVETNHTYNEYGDTASVEVLTGGNPFAKFEYKYDSLGRISSKNLVVNGAAETSQYSYDSIGQLASETTNGVTTSYSYSANGDRYVQGHNEVYDAQDRLVSDWKWNYFYSDNGYLEKKTGKIGTISYSYDNFGNLTSVTKEDGTKIEYVTDGFGRRVIKKVNGQFRNSFIYLDQLRPAAELNEDGSVKSIFVYGQKSNIPEEMIRDGLNYHIVSDRLGSPLFIINSSTGEIAQRMSYDSWGNVLSDSNPGFQPFGFAGGLLDNDTNLVKFGERDYDASNGRWFTKDPIRFNGGNNFYVYTSNDPVNYFDPTGLDITVNYWSDDQGHVGIQVGDGPSYGYYGEYNYSIKAVLGMDSPGHVTNDEFAKGKKADETYTIHTTAEQDEAAMRYISKLMAHPGIYNLYKNDCAIQANKILEAAGIKLPKTIYPSTLFKEVKNHK